MFSISVASIDDVKYLIKVNYEVPLQDESSTTGKVESWSIQRDIDELVALNDTLVKKGCNVKLDLSTQSPSKSRFKIAAMITSRQKTEVDDITKLSLIEKYLRNLLNLAPRPQEFIIFLELNRVEGSADVDAESMPSNDQGKSNQSKSAFNFIKRNLNPVTAINSVTNNVTTAVTGVTNNVSTAMSGVSNNVTSAMSGLSQNKNVEPATPKSPQTNVESTEENKNIEKKQVQDDDTEDMIVEALTESNVIGLLAAFYIISFISLLIVAINFIYFFMSPVKSFFNLFKYAYQTLILFKIVTSTVICTLLTLMYIHRIIGVAVTYFLQTHVRNGNALNMSIDWISFRLGFDRNEIILKNFVWYNPPLFKSTPHFIKVHQIIVVIDVKSTVQEFLFKNTRKSSHPTVYIHSVEIDTCHVYIEKGKKKADGLNLWHALSTYEDEEGELEIQRQTLSKIPFASSFKGLGALGKDVVDAVIKYNPGSLLLNTLSSQVKRKASTSKSAEPENNETENIDVEEDFAAIEDVEESDNEAEVTASNAESPTDSPSNSSQFLLEVSRITVRNFKLHAQDFLAASHIDINSSADALGTIHMALFNMDRRSLTRSRGSKKSRAGVTADALVWKLIDKTIVELFSNHKFTMLAIIGNAVANQTTNAVLDVASTASQTVTNAVYNLNPVELFKAVNRQSSVSQVSLPRSPSVELLDVQSLVVRVISIRNLVCSKSMTTFKCLLRLKRFAKKNEEGADDADAETEYNSELMRTRASAVNREGEAYFNDSFVLRPLISLDCQLHLRVFEAGLISKNIFICEMHLPIRESIKSGTNQLQRQASISATVADSMGLSSKQSETASMASKSKIGMKETEIVSYHNLYESDKDIEKGLLKGEIKLGLSLV